jgi:hypothetical protein
MNLLMLASPLCGGREAARTGTGSRRQIQSEKEISAATHNLGRRGDELLLQGKVSIGAARLVHTQPVSEPTREAGIGRSNWSHNYAGTEPHKISSYKISSD